MLRLTEILATLEDCTNQNVGGFDSVKLIDTQAANTNAKDLLHGLATEFGASMPGEPFSASCLLTRPGLGRSRQKGFLEVLAAVC